MPIDLTVVLTDEPGQLAKLGEATGGAGVNIQGMCAFTGEGRGIIHVLVDNGVAMAITSPPKNQRFSPQSQGGTALASLSG